jgi:hypothetical protein
MIPFTPLNICHKTNTSQKRCYVFGYQVSIRVNDVNPLLELRPWAQISFNDMSERMLILPGDNIAIKYGASKCKEWNSAGCLDWEISEEPSEFEGVRLQPDIHSS